MTGIVPVVVAGSMRAVPTGSRIARVMSHLAFVELANGEIWAIAADDDALRASDEGVEELRRRYFRSGVVERIT